MLVRMVLTSNLKFRYLEQSDGGGFLNLEGNKSCNQIRNKAAESRL